MTDWAAFAASLGGIPCETDPALVKQRSRDFYWYSPVLKQQLRHVTADMVVAPRDEAEVIEVIRRCYAERIAVTARGGGTGNYGQAMPLHGGVVLDLMQLNSIGELRSGMLRVGAGAKLGEIEARCKPLGWELRMFPSTRRTASIGGFVAGGSGGVGSINYGMLREPGTLLGARVVTMEAVPRVLQLRGAEVNRVHHAYGTNGIITELTIAMAPAQDWVDYVVAFGDFMALAHFGDAIARADGIAKRLCTTVDGAAAAYFKPLQDTLRPGEAAGMFLIAAQSAESFEDMLIEHGGRVARKLTEAEAERDSVVPAFEFAWNHTTLQALKVDRGITYLQSRFPGPDYLAAVAETCALYGDELPMHLEFVRAGGEAACVALPLVRFTTEARLRAIIAALEARGITVFDPHTYILEDGGMKQTDPAQLAFKHEADPLGLLNPGKMRGWGGGADSGMSLLQTLSMFTRDGVRLDADVYFPDAPGSYPVLLMRQPYGRRIASTVCYAHPDWYAAQGFIVVIQDVRGRGTSEGVFRTLQDDGVDGAEAIAWAAALPGSNGRVGMYGFSYQGTNQLLAAAHAPPALRALAPAMIGWDVRNDWAYEGGAFCLQAGAGWAIQIAAETAKLAGDATAFDELRRAAQAPPLHGPMPAHPEVLQRHAALSHFPEWIGTPHAAPYWDSISPAAHLQQIVAAGIPSLFIGGWFDSHLPGTLAAYRALQGRVPARLVVGPWAHFPWGRRIGVQDFGPDAVGDMDRAQVAWFGHWLNDAPEHGAPPVRLFDMGRCAWRDFAAWPGEGGTFFVHGTGRAAMHERDGVLSPAPLANAGHETLVHDPWRPVPSVAAAADRALVDQRPDVLTFTTAAAVAGLPLAGAIHAELDITADAPDFDVSCVLSRVLPNGQVLTFAEGYRRVSQPGPVHIAMRGTCLTLPAGEALRLSVAGAAFPAFPVNPGTGQNPAQARAIDSRVITLRLRHGGRIVFGG